jgi:hypothetical protein
MSTPCTIYFVEALVNDVWTPLDWESNSSTVSISGPTNRFVSFTNRTQAKGFLETAALAKDTLGAAELRLSRRVARGTAKV